MKYDMTKADAIQAIDNMQRDLPGGVRTGNSYRVELGHGFGGVVALTAVASPRACKDGSRKYALIQYA